MKISKRIVGIMISVAITAILFYIGIHTIPDNIVSRQDYATIVSAGTEYEIIPTKSCDVARFNTVDLEPKYYIEIEVDGETYKLIGNDLYDTYKDRIGDSIEVNITATYYSPISKFKKMVTIPRAYSE